MNTQFATIYLFVFLLYIGVRKYLLCGPSHILTSRRVFHILMQSIKKSERPKELEPAERKTQVYVNLTKRNENCPVSTIFILIRL